MNPDADTLFCDGTFYMCPTQFQQIYTVHARIGDQMNPLVYSLLLSKSQATYHCKDSLHYSRPRFNLQLNPTTVFLDFEAAVQKAIRVGFPAVSLKGCYFQYAQCIWRKVQQTGLQQLYANNDDVRQSVRRAALEDIDDADVPQDTTPFTDYNVTQWIDRDQQLWNHFETEGPRTTNRIEGWHRKLKKKVEHAHPNIYSIIRVFHEIQASNEITRIQHAAGGQLRPRA
ncbi:uncharacterized protein LOC110448209 [Mizuhopecten yessoensis]|uniref:uncharacterized protein LOC110448209 n=1 Tax=Mizuhopecten yessoensis TaxID=6573 RepID=UPI000B459DFA|nr:uncharacterized protein LOC110448209 [Mizuhopecten yessoensis]